MEIKNGLDRIKEEGKNLQKEVREKTVGYIVAALGLVVGLAWNDAVKALIESLFPVGKDSIAAKFAYAFVITGVLVLATVILLRSAGKSDDKS